MLILLENFFHGEEFGAFGHIDVEDEGVDADHLLVEPDSLPPHSDCRIFQPSDYCLEKLHVHVAWHEVLLSELGENFHHLDPTEGRLILESLEEQLQELVFSLHVNLTGLLDLVVV